VVKPHWGHYAIEAWGLGTFMFVAGTVAVALQHLPAPFADWLTTHATAGRAIFGAAMGLTAMSIVYSPWGARSGAHLNPSVTLTFACLGKLRPSHAAAYVAAQFAGGAVGFMLIAGLAGPSLLGPPAHAIVTKPGTAGATVAFASEAFIAFVLMSVVLAISNAPAPLSRYTGVAAGILVALFITIEAPYSGMSMNPARTLASALAGHDFTAIWIYFTAPPLGMLLAASAFVAGRGRNAVRCGRLNHVGGAPCIFECTYAPVPSVNSRSVP
jgi:aquaporin Z